MAGEEGRVKRECKGVCYWMWRDKRVQVHTSYSFCSFSYFSVGYSYLPMVPLLLPQDNWALLYSQSKALELNVPLHVVVCLPPQHAEFTIRQHLLLP